MERVKTLATGILFKALASDQLKRLTDSIEIGHQLLDVTLVSGDVLIGGLAKHWKWNGKAVSISYNTQAGKKFGSSYFVEIPLELIANINPIPLAEESIPRIPDDDPMIEAFQRIGMEKTLNRTLFVQDYPNPLATIIFNHNQLVCEKIGLIRLEYIEKALSTETIPPEGIILNQDFILYVDWDFFTRQIAGTVSVGVDVFVASISKDTNPSLQTFVAKYLRDHFDKIKKIQDVFVESGLQEIFTSGCIFVPEPPLITEIEGEQCLLIYCANSSVKGESVYPLLLKKRCLKFPLEFLGKISSPFRIYGELLPVPVDVFGKVHASTILVRAIGFLK